MIYVKRSKESVVVSASTVKESQTVIILSQAIVLFNAVCYAMTAYGKTGTDRSQFLIHHACLAPDEDYSIFFLEIMPINQTILYVVDTVIIFGNLYLYRFLQKNTDRKEGKRVL